MFDLEVLGEIKSVLGGCHSLSCQTVELGASDSDAAGPWVSAHDSLTFCLLLLKSDSL